MPLPSVLGHMEWKRDQRIQAYLARAADCERRAAAAYDPVAKKSFTEAARSWREMAAAFAELKRLARGGTSSGTFGALGESMGFTPAPRMCGRRR